MFWSRKNDTLRNTAGGKDASGTQMGTPAAGKSGKKIGRPRSRLHGTMRPSTWATPAKSELCAAIVAPPIAIAGPKSARNCRIQCLRNLEDRVMWQVPATMKVPSAKAALTKGKVLSTPAAKKGEAIC
mmetsp:Transcript_74425/g.147363  ORF Transcript_74425/g.147363 Transcript_74425/m.147363 type:complete len:128 (-) Transcript_74425:710-1093(-)